MLTIAGSVFYYFVIFLPSKENFRQAQFNECDTKATTGAQELLKSKISVAESSGMTYREDYKVWKQASLRGLFLKEDYNEIYENCLRKYGIKY